MLLAREFVSYLSRQIVRKLTPGVLETPNPQVVAEIIGSIVTEELTTEDRLNDEVRDILGQYSDYMRREGVSYQEMFRRIKNTLISQRKVIRASGRDTGDQMKLSRDKITDMSHKIVTMLRKSRDLRMRQDPVAEARGSRRQRGVGPAAQALLRRRTEKNWHRSRPMKPSIVVVGSLNMDFVVSVRHLAAPGETVLGRNFQMFPGGKGA